MDQVSDKQQSLDSNVARVVRFTVAAVVAFVPVALVLAINTLRLKQPMTAAETT